MIHLEGGTGVCDWGKEVQPYQGPLMNGQDLLIKCHLCICIYKKYVKTNSLLFLEYFLSH